MKDGSLARVTGCSAWEGHDTWYRLCAEKGNMQPDRDDSLKVRIQYDSWNTPECEEILYYADAKWFEEDAKNKEIIKAGHGGGDRWVAEEFARYVLEDKEPFFNVYRSVSMPCCSHPDFHRSEEDYANAEKRLEGNGLDLMDAKKDQRNNRGNLRY